MTPWALPASEALFAAAEGQLGLGLALFAADPAAPPGFEAALKSRLSGFYQWETIDPEARPPATAVAECFGALPRVEALAAPALDQMAALIDARRIPDQALVDWATFLGRFVKARSRSGCGLVLAVIEAPDTLDREALRWSAYLRRLDCVIWAETHLPRGLQGLAAALAPALAVELCGWRLDLAQQLVRASRDDLADPLGWLARRLEPAVTDPQPLNGTPFACPLSLRERDEATLRRRVWQAHLPALFPLLEDARIELIQQYRADLQIDEHLAGLGVGGVDEIELGGLRWQLSNRLRQSERLHLDRLVAIRNRLAHRQPANPVDLLPFLKG